MKTTLVLVSFFCVFLTPTASGYISNGARSFSSYALHSRSQGRTRTSKRRGATKPEKQRTRRDWHVDHVAFSRLWAIEDAMEKVLNGIGLDETENASQSVLSDQNTSIGAGSTGSTGVIVVDNEGKIAGDDSEDDENQSSPEIEGVDSIIEPICRLVTKADSKLPSTEDALPHSLFKPPNKLQMMDLYFNAKAYLDTKGIQYLDPAEADPANFDIQNENLLKAKVSTSSYPENVMDKDSKKEIQREKVEQKRLVATVRESLEDAGFELMSRRDIDLCGSLNTGYLLRLSILPEVKDLDPNIAHEFYPERFERFDPTSPKKSDDDDDDDDSPLFEGRVLVFWRGYSEEVTQGRLILPKIDYLQASLVQRSAAWVKKKLDAVEDELVAQVTSKINAVRCSLRIRFLALLDTIPESYLPKKLTEFREYFREELEVMKEWDAYAEIDTTSGSFSLGRYGGSKVRFVGSPNPDGALDPFTICQVSNSTGPETAEGYPLTCEYDEALAKKSKGRKLPATQLIRRVGINNLIDVFTKNGRRKLIRALFDRSELVEPTYEEVVVIWRPLIEEKQKLAPPKFVSEFADMFDIVGFEQPSEEKQEPPLGQLEIRNFEYVPMANFPAVLPKTKLVFRPADALVYDLNALFTLAVVLTSTRLDSPRLDIIALASVAFWLFRTFIRYSNKLAKYELLVKKFLTSKISYRNSGAIKYLITEAGSQRAIRTALAHSYALDEFNKTTGKVNGDTNSNIAGSNNEVLDDPNSNGSTSPLKLTQLIENCPDGINRLLNQEKEVNLNSAEQCIKELYGLDLITLSEDLEDVVYVKNDEEATIVLRETWADLLEVFPRPKKVLGESAGFPSTTLGTEKAKPNDIIQKLRAEGHQSKPEKQFLPSEKKGGTVNAFAKPLMKYLEDLGKGVNGYT